VHSNHQRGAGRQAVLYLVATVPGAGHGERLASPGGECSCVDGWPPSAISLDSVFLILTASTRALLTWGRPGESDPASQPWPLSLSLYRCRRPRAASWGKRFRPQPHPFAAASVRSWPARWAMGDGRWAIRRTTTTLLPLPPILSPPHRPRRGQRVRRRGRRIHWLQKSNAAGSNERKRHLQPSPHPSTPRL